MPSSRRQFLAGTAVGCAALSGCAAVGETTYSEGTDDASEWRYPDYGPESTAHNPDAAGPRDGVTERWNAEIRWVNGRPVVADGTAFVPTVAGLAAFDLDSGDERWTFAPTDQPWAASPTVSGDTVYVGCAAEDGLWALDPSTGERRWHLETRRPIKAEILPSRNGERLYAGDETGRVYVVDAADGAVERTYDAVGAVTSLATRHRPTVVVGTNGGQVYELYDDGEEFYPLWQRRVEGAVQDVAIVDGGSVVVSVFGDYVYKLQNGAHAGSSRWESEFTANDFVAADSHVLGTNLSRLASIEARGGEKQWSRSGDYGCAPAAAGDTFYVGASYDDADGGYLAAYPLGESGGLLSDAPSRRWKRDVPGVPIGGLTVADGALIATTRRESDGTRLRVFDPA